jgi:hypothetical protein
MRPEHSRSKFVQEKPNETKLKGLDFLAFIRPNWGFSMRYDQSKQFFPTLAARSPLCARGLAWLAAILMPRTADASFTHVETMIS